MRTIIFFLSLLAGQFAISQNQWNLIYYENMDYYFKDVQYLNNDNAWVVAQGGIIAHSADGGKDWDIQFNKPSETYSGVFFINDQTGYVVGWSEVYKTTDGGDNWKLQDIPNPLGLDVESVFSSMPIQVGLLVHIKQFTIQLTEGIHGRHSTRTLLKIIMGLMILNFMMNFMDVQLGKNGLCLMQGSYLRPMMVGKHGTKLFLITVTAFKKWNM